MPAAAAGISEVREALGAAIDGLAAAGVEEARLDAELLLGGAMGCDRAALIADPGAGVPASAARAFGEMVRRRLRREPVAYILGTKGFRRLELAVDRRVLIPRPETELLVEIALERRPARVLDVGTGSGAIALAVADELPDCAVTATDTSPGALEVARANAERLGLADRVRFLPGSVPEVGEFDLILANLPYVAERDWASLQPEVTQWEPREALLAGTDGLDAYRALFSDRCRAFPRIAQESSTAVGIVAVAVEVGEGQAPAVAELVRGAGFGRVETRRDLAGIERVVLGER
ncbi:MAG TPA: peptide chain release factor N(5)-glutamine methyltransferase [Solirubrobacterales bacterium]|nr:peptide chain release factor N(5)-glutamine methyltransferase [Solirubrobacterales bacterium]